MRGTTQGLTGVFTGAALVLATGTVPVHAASFRILDQGAAAAGQSDAFTAQADDPSAIYYNPAGMTQLRRVQAYLGAALIGGNTPFRKGPGQTSRGGFNSPPAYPPPGNLYISGHRQDLWGSTTAHTGLA